MTPDNLRIIAEWLDACDAIVSAAIRKPLGNEVQVDLRRWATELAALKARQCSNCALGDSTVDRAKRYCHRTYWEELADHYCAAWTAKQ
jgi:hypothetical protein